MYILVITLVAILLHNNTHYYYYSSLSYYYLLYYILSSSVIIINFRCQLRHLVLNGMCTWCEMQASTCCRRTTVALVVLE